MARANGLDCMFCVGACTCNKKKTTAKKVTKPSPPSPPTEPVPEVKQEVSAPAPKRPNFASVKRVRPMQTVALPAEPKPAAKVAPPRPPTPPPVLRPTKAPGNRFAGVRRVQSDAEEAAFEAAMQVFRDAGFTLERLS